MHRILLILALIMVCSTSWATVDKLPAAKTAPREDPPWADRVGTIKHALAQEDGTVVELDCVHIASRQPFVIYDWYTTGPTLLVDAPLTEDMRPGQVVDVIGTISSTSDGRRIIVCPVIMGYMDGDAGNILVRGGPMTKGTIRATPWPYMIQLY